MGFDCECKLVVNAVSVDNHVVFSGQDCTIRGDIAYMANICDLSLETSTLSLEFTDRETPGGMNSFDFIASTITSAICRREWDHCVVTVTGTGMVNGRTFPFEAVFKDQAAADYVDIVKSFVITGFFDQNGAAPVPQGTIVSTGC